MESFFFFKPATCSFIAFLQSLACFSYLHILGDCSVLRPTFGKSLIEQLFVETWKFSLSLHRCVEHKSANCSLWAASTPLHVTEEPAHWEWFYVFKWLQKKNQRKDIFITRENYTHLNFASLNEGLLELCPAHSGAHFLWLLSCHHWVAVAEAVGPAKPDGDYLALYRKGFRPLFQSGYLVFGFSA